LNWVKNTLGRADGQTGGPYANVDLSQGFKSEGFRNGTALLGLVHKFDNSYVNYSSFSASTDSVTKSNNCTTALKLAQEKMNIPAIIEGDELAQGDVEDKQLVLYLSLLYDSFTERDRAHSATALKEKTQDLDNRLRILTEENVALKAQNLALTTLSEEQRLALLKLQESTSLLTKTSTETETKIKALKEEYSSSTEKWDSEINGLKAKLHAQMEAG